jgi:hypothetical protein
MARLVISSCGLKSNLPCRNLERLRFHKRYIEEG